MLGERSGVRARKRPRRPLRRGESAGEENFERGVDVRQVELVVWCSLGELSNGTAREEPELGTVQSASSSEKQSGDGQSVVGVNLYEGVLGGDT